MHEKEINFREAFDRVAVYFWTQVVGKRPVEGPLTPEEEFLVYKHLIETPFRQLRLRLPQVADLTPSPSHCEELWQAARAAAITHVIDSLAPEILPRLLTATVLKVVGYEDLRRLIFEGRIREETIPPNNFLFFLFCNVYKLMWDLLSRGSELSGPRSHARVLGNPALGELFFGYECGYLKMPTIFSTGVTWILSRITAEHFGGSTDLPEKLFLQSLIPLENAFNEVFIRTDRLTASPVWQRFEAWASELASARERFMSRMVGR